MKLGDWIGRVSLAIILFIVGFAGREAIASQTVNVTASNHSVELPPVPAVRGVLYDGGFPYYAAVVLNDTIQVRNAPDEHAPVTQTFNKVNSEGAPSTFLVTGQELNASNPAWYQVLLPVRPNESKGWVRASDVSIEGMPWRVDVHRKSFKVDLYKDGVWLASYPIGLGTDKTPTPDGLYSIIEVLKPPNPNTLYGTHVLGLNGYSDVETDWPDGGHIALHGTNAPKTTIGQKVSHGCVRLNNSDIDTLAAELPLGTPVRISDG